jgi:hypothetical protein
MWWVEAVAWGMRTKASVSSESWKVTVRVSYDRLKMTLDRLLPTYFRHRRDDARPEICRKSAASAAVSGIGPEDWSQSMARLAVSEMELNLLT